MEVIVKTVLPQHKKRGLTIGQVADFAEQCRRVGLPDDTPIEARVGFKGQVHTLIAKPVTK